MRGRRSIGRGLRRLPPLLSLLFATVLGAAAPVSAADCSPVAAGLANPRFVAVDPAGTLYVSEAGIGGDEVLPPAPGGPPLPPGPPPGRGLSGRVTRIDPGGAKTVVAGNLPSYRTAEGVSGPAGLAFAGGALWLASGGAGPLTAAIQPLANEASVLRITPQTGGVMKVADLDAYERANNPGGFAVDTNPYGLAVAPNGTVYVADAGGNTLFQVNPSTGQLNLVAVIPGLPGPMPNPARGNRNELDPVPTGVAVGPDGTIYVALLSGAPFPQGAARIVRVAPNGALANVATGLTALGDVVVGPDRLLYVTEIFSAFDLSVTPPVFRPGRVLRLWPDGRREVIAGDLSFPNGLAFDRLGNLYVVVGANTPDGQVLRCDRVALAGVAGLPATGSGPDQPHGDAGGAPGRHLPALWYAGAAVAAVAAAGWWRRRQTLGRVRVPVTRGAHVTRGPGARRA